MRPGEAVVVGAGLAGALLATRLGRAGWRVTVLEKREDPRSAGGAGGRTIHLAVSERARGLITDAVPDATFRRISVPVTARVVHPEDGPPVVQAYGTRRPGRPADRLLVPGEPLHAVGRGALAAALVDAAARQRGVRLRFGHEVVEVDVVGPTVRVTGPRGEDRLTGELLVGADGAFSIVRGALAAAGAVAGEPALLPIEHAHLRIASDGPGDSLRVDAHHLWTRPGAVLSALPEPGGGFGASLFLPRAAGHGFDALADDPAQRDFLRARFPDVADRLNAPGAMAPGRVATVRCRPWHAGRVVLVGDACHALVPFTSQGANAALEGAAALADALIEHAPDRERGIAAYTERRRAPMDALSDLSDVISPLVLWLAGVVSAVPRG